MGDNRGDRLFDVNLFNQKTVAMILPMILVKGGGEVVEL